MPDGQQLLAALHDNTHQHHHHPFCLPPTLISALVPHHHHLTGAPPHRQSARRPSSPADQPGPHGALQNFSCTLCQVEFTTTDSQRAHFKSDWHRLNLKLKASASERTVKEDEFQAMVERLEHSLSGSGLSSSEHDSDSDLDHANIRFKDLLVRSNSQAPARQSSGDDEDDEAVLGVGQKGPLVWFTVSEDVYRDPDGTRLQFGFYRCIFPTTFVDDGRATGPTELGERYLAELAQIQHIPALLGAPADPQLLGFPTWTMLMVAGGHFAGMVVSVVPKLRHVAKNRPPELEPVIIHSKTFHRYTTRRKQGGGQATHDAGGKGAAKSAGANLRRYNEQSLTQDIRNLLATWSSSLNASNLIFIRSSKSNLKIFFDNQPSTNNDDCSSFNLDRQDPRIRTLPFVTKRPTLNELKRCFDELTRVKIVRLTRADIEQLEAEAEAVRQKAQQRLEARQLRLAQQAARLQAASAPAPVVVVDRQKELELSRWTRVVEIVKKGKTDALREFVGKYPEGGWFGRVPAEAGGGFVSLLQIAAAEEQAEMVETLLVEWACDPTVRGEDGGRGGLAAYELAGTRPTRNAFRRAMARHPERWDWTGEAKVPSGLTEEMEAQQATKGKERKQRLKDKVRERERARAQADEAARLQAEADERLRKAEEERTRSERGLTINRLGGGSARKTVVKSADEILGLSEDQRIKLERERRARAAEARLR